MIVLEGQTLESCGFKPGEVHREFTIIQMDGAPFKVRTFYIGKNDHSKKTLVLCHGNYSQFIGLFRFNKIMSEKYRIVGFDLYNLGLNTRSTSKAPHESWQTADKWMVDFMTKAIDAMDLPDKFFLSGHSLGGYSASLYATQRPERIESLFLMSPAGTETHDPNNYDKYNYISV